MIEKLTFPKGAIRTIDEIGRLVDAYQIKKRIPIYQGGDYGGDYVKYVIYPFETHRMRHLESLRGFLVTGLLAHRTVMEIKYLSELNTPLYYKDRILISMIGRNIGLTTPQPHHNCFLFANFWDAYAFTIKQRAKNKS
jgi:hypothetical protein